ALRLAGQHRTDFHALDTGRLNRRRQIFRDLAVHMNDHITFVIELVFQGHAADNTVAQRLNDFAGFDDRLDVDSIAGAAIRVADNDVLSDVAETAGQVAGVGRLQRSVGQTFARAVSRDEVLQYVEAFAEVGRDRAFNN